MAEVQHRGYAEGDYLEDDYLSGGKCEIVGMQVGNTTSALECAGMLINQTQLKHISHGKYLEDDYLEEAYLTGRRCVLVGMQVIQENPANVGMQVTQAIYNTCAFRILCDFTSRGIPSQNGLNWTADSEATGDFSVNNLNTDIVEQVYRSVDTVTTVTLTCDTGVVAGVGIDTLGIINHNLSRNAIVQLQGSKDNFATSPDFSVLLDVTLGDMIYIAESIPVAASINQYWRLIIQDTGNPDDFIQIGTVVFGEAEIFSKDGELGCPSEPIVAGKRHFKDQVQTEGFTNVMNDRSLKKYVRVNFNKILVEGKNRDGTNFNILNDYSCEQRTSLKCLIVPTPGCIVNGVDSPDAEKAARFGVFAKLARMPEWQYISADCDTIYASARFEWDESL